MRFSSLSRLKRVVAYCLRFKENSLHRKSRISGTLEISELERAMTRLVSLAQQREFSDEIESLKVHSQVKTV